MTPYTYRLVQISLLLCYSACYQAGFFQEKYSYTGSVTVYTSQNRKRHCFTQYLSSGYSLSTGITVRTLQDKRKPTLLMEEGKKAMRESDRNRGKTRVNVARSRNGECSEVMSKSAPPLVWVSLITRTWDGSKPAFFLLEELVTKPAYLSVQAVVLLCLFIAGSNYDSFALALDSCQAAGGMHVANTVFATAAQTAIPKGNESLKLSNTTLSNLPKWKNSSWYLNDEVSEWVLCRKQW